MLERKPTQDDGITWISLIFHRFGGFTVPCFAVFPCFTLALLADADVMRRLFALSGS